MRIRNKIYLGYLGIAMLVAIVGVFGLIATRLAVEGFEGNEEQLKRMVETGSEMSSYSKRAEGHLLLYLALHDEVDREKFLKRCAKVDEQIAILEDIGVSGEAGILLRKAKFNMDIMVTTGTALIEAHDRDMRARGQTDLRDYRDLIQKIHSVSREIREAGNAIVGIATDSLNKQEAITAALEVTSYVKRVEAHLMLYLTLNEPVDRERFFKRHESLVKNLDILKKRLKESRDSELLEKAHSEAAELLLVGENLFVASDARGGFQGGLGLEGYEDEIRKANELASSIRRAGVSLAQSQSDLIYSRKLLAMNNANRLQLAIIAVIVMSFLAVMVAGYLFSNAITRPLKALQEAAGKIGEGDLDTVIELKSNDELSWLGDAFTSMVSNLKLTTMSRDHFDSINNSMNDSLIVATMDGTISYANRATTEMLGYGRGELEGRPVDVVSPSLRQMLEAFTEDTSGSNTQSREMEYLPASGEAISVSCTTGCLAGRRGQLQGVVFSAQDITQSKSVREKLKGALEEREVLLREIHHRVKNNMMLVTAMLSMQAHCLDDESLSAAFNDVINRIRSMSLVHERLYKSKDFVDMDIKGYFRTLINDLSTSLKRPGQDVAVSVDVVDVHIGIDRLMRLGLIVNELVTNSFKHAFNGEKQGKIDVSLSVENDMVTLMVSDNGQGIPEAEGAGEESRTLGLKLIRALVDQLDGEFHLSRDKGTLARITFNAAE